MGIDIQWYDDQHKIVLIRFDEHWTWQDFYALDPRSQGFLNSVQHEICYIVDLSQTRKLPQGVSLRDVRQVLEFRHPLSDWVILVGISPYLRAILSAVLSAMSDLDTTFIYARHLDEALDLARQRLATLAQRRA